MTQVVRYGRHAMGGVSIWAKWLVVTAGLVLFPVVVLLLACLIGWSLVRPLWPRREVTPR